MLIFTYEQVLVVPGAVCHAQKATTDAINIHIKVHVSLSMFRSLSFGIGIRAAWCPRSDALIDAGGYFSDRNA